MKSALTLRGKLEKELQNMVDQSIIVSVSDGESNWVNLLGIREKPGGRLHICLDPKGLNKVIRREHHPLPTVDDITHRLCGSTLIQAWCCTGLGMFHLPRNHKPWKHSTHTRLGIKFLRITFGLRMFQDIFQRNIHQTYENCSGAAGITDDTQVLHDDSTHEPI